jgi:hypothetical protein
MNKKMLSICLGLTTLATWTMLSVLMSGNATASEVLTSENKPTQAISSSEEFLLASQTTTQENVGGVANESSKVTITPLTEICKKNSATKISQRPNEEVFEQNNCPQGQNAQPADVEVPAIINQLDDAPKQTFATSNGNSRTLSPGFTISNPNGFGSDNNTIFLVTDYQGRTRYTNSNDGEAGIGIGLGDARKAVGVELSYTQDSFGRNGKSGGGFNVKVHRRTSDDSSIAVGWNHFATIDSTNYLDYPKNSYYAAYTKIFKTKEYLEQPLSRVAVTAGIGSGQFLNEAGASSKDPNGLNVFGTVAVRVAKPVSAIAEWTGQDLAIGLSIVPFENIPIVITPAFRDITGAGDGARFVLGTGISFKF